MTWTHRNKDPKQWGVRWEDQGRDIKNTEASQWLRSSKVIRKYSILPSFSGCKKMANVSRELSQKNGGKENTGFLCHNCLRTDNHIPWGRVGSPETAVLTLWKYWLQSQTSLAKSTLGQDTELKFPLSFHQDLWEKSWVSLAPHNSKLIVLG